ncbi:4-amino-4-deoxychorismate lyase [Sinomonas cyclohexanicum]|uniref:4-amino-4-deoxychorismate lyase n=1 Tax=Sinomonas cyclohexanicum TaxID=322009 RepID=A0ABM7PZ54_SINCY|nr:aminodeoxychorismate lyase [Corynebacterium cyclohexanicum]BCT77582.1 4-amino-4-deoxychorismate lyase [Corynebacterium cyclohexanicum]
MTQTVLVFLDRALPDGRIEDATKPQLFATDLGATRGDGVFETLLVLDGHVRKLPAHLSRMQHSAAVLELEVPGHEAWERAIVTALDEYQRAVGPLTEVVVKLVATRGVEGAHEATCWVAASAPAPAAKRQREEGIDVLLLDRGYDSDLGERAPWLLLGAKTLSYAVNMAALRYAHSHGADDVIFTSSDGQVLEGPTSTVLLAHAETDDAGRVTARRLVTPRLDSGILPGTSQGALFAAAKEAGWELGYGPLVPDDLFDADAVWLISSVRLLTPVNHLDGKPIGADPVLAKALTDELAALFDKIH